jgi:hypothetical protein
MNSGRNLDDILTYEWQYTYRFYGRCNSLCTENLLLAADPFTPLASFWRLNGQPCRWVQRKLRRGTYAKEKFLLVNVVEYRRGELLPEFAFCDVGEIGANISAKLTDVQVDR